MGAGQASVLIAPACVMWATVMEAARLYMHVLLVLRSGSVQAYSTIDFSETPSVKTNSSCGRQQHFLLQRTRVRRGSRNLRSSSMASGFRVTQLVLRIFEVR